MLLTLLYILTGLAFLAVIITLVMGAVAMGNKSEESRKASNNWMWRRIYAQVTAVVLVLLTLYVKTKGG